MSSDTGDLAALYSQLRLSISGPRVERRAGRSRAIWDSEKSLMQIVRKEGKFDTFGTYIDNKLYLEYYEALYLLELGRLQVDKDNLTLSIEQAYLLLLGELPTPKYNEYLVYSYLTRAGYILMRHQNKFYSHTFMHAPKEVDCIWAWLLNAIDGRTVPNYIKKTEMFGKVKQQIEDIKLTIMQQQDNNYNQAINEESISPSKKLKLDEQQQETEPNQQPEQSIQQKNEFWATVKEKSFLNFLMTEPEFIQFEKLFQKFDVIKLKSSESQRENAYDSSDNDDMDDVYSGRNFSINFDLHLHNNGFKKSLPIPPVMRVLILDSKQSFPSHKEIRHCCQHLFYGTPLLIVSVGDAKQIQAFLYLFT